MKLPPYITFMNDAHIDALCILQTDFPHYIGLIYKCTNGNELEACKALHVVSSQVAGYNILITFARAFSGNRVLFTDNIKVDLQAQIDAMASYYLVERIGKDLGR